MKTAKIGFMYIALLCTICAIWLPDQRWPFIITAAVLLVAAGGLEASEMQSEKDDKK